MGRLTMSRADVTIDGEVHKRVNVSLRNGVAVVRRNGRVLFEVADVADLVMHSPKRFTITFTDGTSWDIVKSKCACTGSV